MKRTLNNVMYFDGDAFKSCNVTIDDGTASFEYLDAASENAPLLCVLPGFVDVHVHFREPGFSYKETIKSGSMSAAAGGYTDVCTMPNLNPAPDSPDNLKIQTDIIKTDAVIGVHPYGTITKKQQGAELSDFDHMAHEVIGFSDDGRGVQRAEIMKQAMTKAKQLDKIIAAHCEDNSLLNNGYIHLGEYAQTHNHRGISSASEYEQIKRDIELVRMTGAKYHICHISTAQSVEVIRKAKAEGLDITCETGPHYLVLSDKYLQEDGAFKMNPPLRSESDRLALVDGIKDGTIDMIATDHAPHSLEEKSKGLEYSAMGIVGLETAFPVLYTHLVKTGIISFKRLIELLHHNPKNRFKINSSVEDGTFTVFDLNKNFIVDPLKFQSKGRATPFKGSELFGKCVMTFYKGNLVWEDNHTERN